ncbi:hypothetical protein NA57DRAFT_31872 [Rhizodiscina lignyota]|uniref:DSC E3 ubiquitin ligase complex subunit A n=1 Tax=Rhizodiscina lignyota TaxID=1504668 RepID=A0A9P4IP14_9PEZI|nr:hypothetical protein NA57DRAFT_31872 [Rhizodiscina lignyota]
MATNPRAVVLLILLILLLFSPDPQTQSLPQRFRFDDVLDREFYALNVLNHSSYGDFEPSHDRWLNISGFRKSDGFAWEALDEVKERVRGKIEWVIDADAAHRFPDSPDEQEGFRARLPLYRNISGFARGTWVRSSKVTDVHTPTLNRTALGISSMYGNQPFNRNITGDSGSVKFHFDERGLEFLQEKDGVKESKAQLTIHDESSSGEGWEMKLHGVHFLESGLMVMTTTSEKFAGIFGLPQFMPSNTTFNSSMALLNQTIREIIQEQKDDIRIVTNPWTSASDGTIEGIFSPPHCEYVVWLQQHPLNMPEEQDDTSKSQYPLESVEKELRYPSGYIYKPPPSMKMEMLIFSPDCGFVLESKGPPEYTPRESQHLLGPKIEVITNTGRHLTMIFGAVLCGQIYLALIQMKEASTPSTRSRISFYTVAILSMGDGFTAMAFLPLGMFVESMFLNFLAVSFFAFFSVTFLDLRFLMDIWMVQDEERRRQVRQQNARNSGDSTPSPNTTAQPTPPSDTPVPATLPLPATARRNLLSGATPIILPSDQDDEAGQTLTTTGTNDSPTRRFGALYTRFYALLLIIVFLSLHATSWPLGLRSAYMNLLAFIYLSCWIPQIYRNTMRNCRKALLWKYVVGQSVLRLVPFAYFYGIYDNVLFVENDRRALLVLAGWVWVQVWILVIQNLLGPRIFVKKSWVPPAYDYHPILREDEEGATMPIGFTQATDADTSSPSSPTSRRPSVVEKEKGKRLYDCAICMQDIEVPVVLAGGADTSSAASLPANILARRAYMVTPCRHIFHTHCLEGWMRYRLACPICRETLPPL